VKIEASASSLKAMVERVALYKTVVEKNRSDHRNEPSKQEEEKGMEMALNMDNVKEVRGRLSQLH
jgi:hypothetical protein